MSYKDFIKKLTPEATNEAKNHFIVLRQNYKYLVIRFLKLPKETIFSHSLHVSYNIAKHSLDVDVQDFFSYVNSVENFNKYYKKDVEWMFDFLDKYKILNTKPFRSLK